MALTCLYKFKWYLVVLRPYFLYQSSQHPCDKHCWAKHFIASRTVKANQNFATGNWKCNNLSRFRHLTWNAGVFQSLGYREWDFLTQWFTSTLLPQSLHFAQVRREKHSTSRWRGKWGVNVVAISPPHSTCDRETPQCLVSQPKAAPSWLSMDAESLLHSKGSPV